MDNNRLIMLLVIASMMALAAAEDTPAETQYGGHDGPRTYKTGYSNLVYSPTTGLQVGFVAFVTTAGNLGTSWCAEPARGCFITNTGVAKSTCPAGQPIAIDCACACAAPDGNDSAVAGCYSEVTGTGKCVAYCDNPSHIALSRALCGPKTTTHHTSGGRDGYPDY